MSQLACAEEVRNRSIVGLILTPAICAGIGAVIGYAYAYFVDVNPLIYIGFIAAIAVGFAIGFATIIVGGIFGSSDKFTRFLAVLAGLAACLWVYYCQWLNAHGVTPWASAAIESWYKFGFVEPFKVAFEEIAPQMNYSVSRAGRGSNDLGTGGAMWFWIIELGLVILTALAVGAFAEGDIINKATGGTMKPLDNPLMIAHLSKADVQNAQSALQARDLSLFQMMSEADIARVLTTDGAKKREKVPASVMNFFLDSKDPDTYSVEVTQGYYQFDKTDGWEENFDDDVVLKHLLISKTEYIDLLARLTT